MGKPVLSTDEILFAEHLRTLREERGMSKRALANAMGYSESRVSHVERLTQRPNDDFARAAERELSAAGTLWERWQTISASRNGHTAALDHELRLLSFVAWLADHSTHTFPDLYDAVCDRAARIAGEPAGRRHSRDHAKRHVSRAGIAHALRRYYGPDGFYTAAVDGTPVHLSIASRPAWLDVAVPLGGAAEQIRYVPPQPWDYQLDDFAVAAAVERLATAELDGTVMVDNPLYRLLDVDLEPGRLSATVTTVPFAEHAMGAELMEGETLAAVVAGTDEMPLRDRHLPSTAAVWALDRRTCIGGPTMLLAVARRNGTTRDYVLFAQERSSSVLNLAGKLAVVPKGFHQPTGEPHAEAALSATLRRELEEELLGREDLEQVEDPRPRHGAVDLLHPQHLTAPVAWLLDRPDAWRSEVTGLGFNTLTSNYEFACLTVIDDDGWWERFGHMVVSNWEADRIYRYSTRDTAGLAALVQDPRWGNESLFGLLQGLRRLAVAGDPSRLALPTVELDL